MSGSNCCFLTHKQVSQEAGNVVWYSHLFKNFPQFPHKGFSVVSEAEVYVFLEFPWFPHDPMNVNNLMSVSSASLRHSLCIWKFSVHTLLKPTLKDFKHYLANMLTEPNDMVVWTFFSIALLWDWIENRPFPVLWPLLSFPNLLTYWAQDFNSIIF